MKNNRAYLLRTEIIKSHLNNRICQLCGVKTSTVTPSFYYVFNISLSCNNGIPKFIGNLWRVLLLGNHLKSQKAGDSLCDHRAIASQQKLSCVNLMDWNIRRSYWKKKTSQRGWTRTFERIRKGIVLWIRGKNVRGLQFKQFNLTDDFDQNSYCFLLYIGNILEFETLSKAFVKKENVWCSI